MWTHVSFRIFLVFWWIIILTTSVQHSLQQNTLSYQNGMRHLQKKLNLHGNSMQCSQNAAASWYDIFLCIVSTYSTVLWSRYLITICQECFFLYIWQSTKIIFRYMRRYIRMHIGFFYRRGWTFCYLNNSIDFKTERHPNIIPVVCL